MSFKISNRTVVLILIFILVGGLTIYFTYKQKQSEYLTNISETDQQVIDSLYDFYMNNTATDYITYLNFLENIKNTNMNLVNKDVFLALKILKNNDSLTKDDIIKEMKLE